MDYKVVESEPAANKFVVKIAIDKLWVDEINRAKESQVKNLKVPGFRKGKVPLEMAEKYLNMPKLFENAIQKCLRRIMPQVLQDSCLQGKDLLTGIFPTIDVDSLNADSVVLKLTFLKNPQLTLPDYKKIPLTASTSQTVTDEEVKQEIKRLLDEQAEMVVKDTDKASMGDVAIIDYIGKINGQIDERACARNFELKLGSDQFIPGFESGIVGMKVGTSKVLDLRFPPDYALNLANQPVEFTVTLNELKEIKYPQLDSETVSSLTRGAVTDPSGLDK